MVNGMDIPNVSHRWPCGPGILAFLFLSFANPSAGNAAEFPINTTTANPQRESVVQVTAAGDFIVARESQYQDGDEYGIYARRFNAAGTPLSGEILVNTETIDTQNRPSVAIDGLGDFVITWQSNDQDSNNNW